jgi:hypothetical protein
MKARRLVWIAAAILLLSWVLAFPLRDVLERLVIVPVAYLLWVLGVFYRVMPQVLWWVLLSLAVLIMLLGSLAPGERIEVLRQLHRPPEKGQVEELAGSIQKSNKGVYFKWIVANRLGKLAYSMLVQREGERSRSVFAPLAGPGFEPSARLRTYLESGLHGSFSDYPEAERARLFTSSPLDFEAEEALKFLESQMEARRD